MLYMLLAKHSNTQTEADEKIRRALRNKVRASEQVFENGDRVFYKREGKERWLGPGKVVFQDGKVVFVRHGDVFVRVSPNRLQKVHNNMTDETEREAEQSIEERSDENNDREEETESHTIWEDLPAPSCDERTTQNGQQIRKALKANDIIQYRVKNGDEWTKATVLGRAGKATGKNRYWYNLQDDISKEKKSVNLDQAQWQLITDDANVNIVTKQNRISSEDTSAKLAELQKLRHFNTYEEVKDCGQQTLSTRWIITNKEGQTKARLVVRGFEEDFMMPRDSPTVGKGTMKIFLAVSSINNWTIKTTDIKSAFLQASQLRSEANFCFTCFQRCFVKVVPLALFHFCGNL